VLAHCNIDKKKSLMERRKYYKMVIDMAKKCIVCQEKATMTTIREDVEAAFCDKHYPAEIRILLTIKRN